jgi:cytosine/adenosine deaminase-related metal-dependent hydrolase
VDDTPLCIHLAEGVNAAAADEVRALDQLGLLDSRLLAVHVVGADDEGIRRLRLAGAACLWCPTSNLFLFGQTSPRELLAPGIDVLLGSDSLLTADGDLLDELRAARSLRLIDDDRLRAAVGPTAARRLGLRHPSLEPGAPADLVVLRRPLLEASAHDVALVLVGGDLRLIAPGVAGLDGFDLRQVRGPGGVQRLIARDAAWPGTTPADWGEGESADATGSAVHAAAHEQPRPPSPYAQPPRH